MPKKINVSIVGVTGYTGLELLRLIKLHPFINICHLVSENNAGQALSDVWPHLKGIIDEPLIPFHSEQIIAHSDCVFFALPHGVSQKFIPKFYGAKTKLIDLAGDFRLKDPAAFETYYGQKHSYTAGLKDFVYGLPEIFKDSIVGTSHIANPGCFAITTQLALFPLKGLIDSAAVFAVTGSSGAGKTPKAETHHPVRNHNMQSYKIDTHQHLPEILATLHLPEESLTFIPTSGPFTRGIHLSAVVQTKENLTQSILMKRFTKAYKNCPFIRIKNRVMLAEVVGSNYCDISVTASQGKVVIQAVIDNLVKGAAGTALQNFNLMFEFPEELGLSNVGPAFP